MTSAKTVITEEAPTEEVRAHDPETPMPAYLLQRVFVLGLLLCMIHFWLQRHLGVEFWKGITGFVGVTIFAALGGNLLPMFGRGGEALWKTILRRGASLLVDTRFLIILALAVLLLGSSWSSITVIAAGAEESIQVTVQADDGRPATSDTKSLGGPNAMARFMKFTNPFGKPYSLQAEGYQRFSFELYPWVGATIRVLHQLVPTPSVLLRVPHAVASALTVGQVELFEVQGEKEYLLGECPTQADRASVIFGREPPLSDHLLHQWDIELTAVGFTDSSKSKALMTWQRPLSGSMTNELRPGMQLAAYFRGRDKEVLASRHFRLGTEKLQDVSLLPIQ